METALRYLGSRPRTRWELERRLRRAGVQDSVIDPTLQRLAAMGYLDDAAFARWWAEQRDRHAPRGRRMLEAELRQRGVPREVIQAHREAGVGERAPEDAGIPENDEQRARVALERHLRGRPLPTDRNGLQRLGMYLMNRGFDSETARTTIRSLAAGEPDEA